MKKLIKNSKGLGFKTVLTIVLGILILVAVTQLYSSSVELARNFADNFKVPEKEVEISRILEESNLQWLQNNLYSAIYLDGRRIARGSDAYLPIFSDNIFIIKELQINTKAPNSNCKFSGRLSGQISSEGCWILVSAKPIDFLSRYKCFNYLWSGNNGSILERKPDFANSEQEQNKIIEECNDRTIMNSDLDCAKQGVKILQHFLDRNWDYDGKAGYKHDYKENFLCAAIIPDYFMWVQCDKSLAEKNEFVESYVSGAYPPKTVSYKCGCDEDGDCQWTKVEEIN